MKKLDKHLELISTIIKSNDKVVKTILKTCDKSFINFIGELSLNILKEVIILTKYYIKRLKTFSKIIRLIGSNKVKIEKRRRLCVKYNNVIILLLKACQKYF